MEEVNNNHNQGNLKTRYSDLELQEFKDIINSKLESARSELQYLNNAIKSPNETGNDDALSSNKILEEGSATFEREQLSQLADRQRKFIKNLEDALARIESKTYGVCKVSGELISKERLKAVPHTTMSIEAKHKERK